MLAHRCQCGKQYKTNSGYERHKNKCLFHKQEPTTTTTTTNENGLKNTKIFHEVSLSNSDNTMVVSKMLLMLKSTINHCPDANNIVNLNLFVDEKSQTTIDTNKIFDAVDVIVEQLGLTQHIGKIRMFIINDNNDVNT